MAFNWAAAAAVGGAGASLGGSIISAANASRQNDKMRDFARYMYAQEREDNLAQWNRENEYGEYVWNKMNAYNSPMAQMDRFKEAGLNPNLIYGQGSNAPAIQTGRYDAPKHNMPSQRPVDFGGIGTAIQQGLANYVQFRQVAAQTDNIKAATEVARQDAIFRATQTAGVALDNSKKSDELPYVKDYANSQLRYSLQAVEKLTNDMILANRRDEREEASNVAYLAESAERILASRGQRVSTSLDNTLKQLDIKLKQRGINPSDPTWLRIIGQVLSGSISDMERKAKNMLNGL